MPGSFVAVAHATIAAPPAKVWEALTDPDLITKYFHGTTVESDWEVGSPITWTGEMGGTEYLDKGEIVVFEPEVQLRHTHWSNLTGEPDEPEYYKTVTYDLAEVDGSTQLTLTQDNMPSQEAADEMVAKGWQPILEGLKSVVEE
jgi:uncharacterized protein YndB with AHSA1/START domain